LPRSESASRRCQGAGASGELSTAARLIWMRARAGGPRRSGAARVDRPCRAPAWPANPRRLATVSDSGHWQGRGGGRGCQRSL